MTDLEAEGSFKSEDGLSVPESMKMVGSKFTSLTDGINELRDRGNSANDQSMILEVLGRFLRNIDTGVRYGSSEDPLTDERLLDIVAKLSLAEMLFSPDNARVTLQDQDPNRAMDALKRVIGALRDNPRYDKKNDPSLD